jgi:hypothetical protein
MKLTIEIADLRDQHSCILAAERMYEAFVEKYGVFVAEYIFSEAKYGHGYSLGAISRRNFARVCGKLPDDDLRVVLEYYAMPKPSKRGLAVELAKRNKTLPREKQFYRGTQVSETMLTQIKRVYSRYKNEWAVIGGASPALRHQELTRVTEACALLRDPRFIEHYRKLTRAQLRRGRKGDIS